MEASAMGMANGDYVCVTIIINVLFHHNQSNKMEKSEQEMNFRQNISIDRVQL
jgi:hypothetical protein